jgi:hypothetical protein
MVLSEFRRAKSLAVIRKGNALKDNLGSLGIAVVSAHILCAIPIANAINGVRPKAFRGDSQRAIIFPLQGDRYVRID